MHPGDCRRLAPSWSRGPVSFLLPWRCRSSPACGSRSACRSTPGSPRPLLKTAARAASCSARRALRADAAGTAEAAARNRPSQRPSSTRGSSARFDSSSSAGRRPRSPMGLPRAHACITGIRPCSGRRMRRSIPRSSTSRPLRSRSRTRPLRRRLPLLLLPLRSPRPVPLRLPRRLLHPLRRQFLLRPRRHRLPRRLPRLLRLCLLLPRL